MPGLLQAPPERFGRTRYLIATFTEAIGAGIFAFAGTAVLSKAAAGPDPNIVWAALGNGFALAVTIYCCANVSGGHISPSVTIATMITGHIPIVKGLAYMLAQVIGSIFGMLLIAGLTPGVHIGMGNSGAGCFAPQPGVSKVMLFGWEFVVDFILVSTVYAVAIGEPHFGNVAPLIVGLSLSADLLAAAAYTGGGVSPARVIAPAIVFNCHWDTAWVYVLGDMAGGIAAGMMSCPLYGDHAPWWDKMMPWGDHHMKRETMERESISRMLDAVENGQDSSQARILSSDRTTSDIATDSQASMQHLKAKKIKPFSLAPPPQQS